MLVPCARADLSAALAALLFGRGLPSSLSRRSARKPMPRLAPNTSRNENQHEGSAGGPGRGVKAGRPPKAGADDCTSCVRNGVVADPRIMAATITENNI